MPRYYLHVHDTLHAIDEEGVDLPNLRAAYAKAISGLRDIVSHEVRSGVLSTYSQVSITDERGKWLGVVTFMDAIEVRSEAAAHL